MKRKREGGDEGPAPVEKQDGVFESPLAIFTKFPHNDTFVDAREIVVVSTPNDNTTAESYTFYYKGTNFGMMKTNKATLNADVALRAANGALTANDRRVCPIFAILRNMFKTKNLEINGTVVTTSSNYDHHVSYIRTITTEVPDDVEHLQTVNGAIYDTSGSYDSSANIHDGGGGLVNLGARARQQLFCGSVVRVIDYVDTVCFNEDGMDRFVPTDFDMKLELVRNAKNKYLFGLDAHCTAATLHLEKFELRIPSFKPTQLISEAINKLMTTMDEEARYYTTYYRFVARPLRAGLTDIQENDVFNGSLPVRVYTGIMTQARHNGSFELNPFLYALPDFSHYQVRINNSPVVPEIYNPQEAYRQICTMLKRLNRKMTFSFEEFQNEKGLLATDLTANRDSYNQVLPNETNGQVSIYMKIKTDGGLADASQLHIYGEFRNELKIGFKTPPRRLFNM